MTQSLAFWNGQLLPADQVRIPLSDAGFVLGATVTEQLRTFGGQLFQLDRHLDRLVRSLEIVGVDPGLSRGRLAEIAREVAAVNFCNLQPGDDLGVGMLVTPGPYTTLAGDSPPGPNVIVYSYPLPFGQWAHAYQQGVTLLTSNVVQVPRGCWPAELKCRSRMHYFLADQQAQARQPGSKALLLDQEGYVSETSTANVLLVEDETHLVSPPLSDVLPGISLEMVRTLCQARGWRFSERRLRPADLHASQEVLLSSTPNCLLPVASLDGRPIGAGQPGPVFTSLLNDWSAKVGVDIVAQARRFMQR